MSLRLRPLLAGGLTALVVLAVLAGASLLWLGTTRSGARWAFDRLGAGLRGRIEVEDIRGRLRGPLHLHHLHYQADTWELTAADVRLDWDLRRLPLGRIDVHWLLGDSVTIRLKPPAERAAEQAAQPLPDVHLPIDFAFARARVTHLAWYRDSTAAPLLADSLVARGLDLADTLRAADLSAAGPAFAATVRGRLSPHGTYGVALDGAWSFQPRGRPWIGGAGTFRGSLDTLLVEQRLDRPWTGTVRGRLFRPARDASFDLEADLAGVRPRAFVDSFPEGSWSARVRLAGRPARFDVTGRFASREAWWGPVDGTGSVRIEGGRWTFERLDLAVPGSPMRATARGVLEPAPHGLAGDLTASWTHLTWPTVPPPNQGWSSPSGRARLRGPFDRYHVVADGELAIVRMPASTWHVEGNGGLQGLEIARAISTSAGGEARVTGRVAWAPLGRWDLSGRGAGLESAWFLPSFPGTVTLVARAAGTAPAGRLAGGTVTVDSLSGTVRGTPVTGAAAFNWLGERWTIGDGTLVSGPDSLRVRGQLLPAWDLDWRIAAPDLRAVLPNGGGALRGAGRLAGTSRAPRVVADLRADSVFANGATLAYAVLRADLDPARAMTLDLSASGLRAGSAAADSIVVTSRGPRTATLVNAAAFHAGDRLDLAIAGGGDLERWTGRLERLDLVSARVGRWSLAAPAALTRRAGRLALEDARWTSGGSTLATDLAWGPAGAWAADATITALPLELAAPVLPAGAGWSGAVDGVIHLKSGAGGALIGTVDLAPGPGTMRYAVAGADSSGLRFDRGRFEVRADAAGVTGTLRLTFPAGGALDVDGRLPGFSLRRPFADQPLTGRLRADFTDLGFLPAIEPAIANTGGVLHADLVLGGTLGSPLPAGELTLTGGRADVPARGVQLRDVDVRATPAGSGSAAFRATARSGPGTLTVDGRVTAIAGPNAALHARATGERFLVSNTAALHAVVSPDLTIDADANRLVARGDLTVPSAELRSTEPAATVVPISRDVVVVSSGRETRSLAGPDIDARVRVVLGSDVRVNALGFEGRAEGTVVVSQSPGDPKATASGEIHAVEGRYRAYGQDLTVDRARLVFDGPLDDPRVDIRASRTAPDNVVAGVEVRGTVRQPQLQVFSSTAMGESQAISYVLFGRPLDDVTTGQGAEATRLASALEVPAGDLLLGQIAPGLGLEGAHVTTSTAAAGPAFELGRTFSPRLYLAYSVGLLDPVSTLQLRYTLSRLWSLGAEVAARENRADIRYNVEW